MAVAEKGRGGATGIGALSQCEAKPPGFADFFVRPRVSSSSFVLDAPD